MSLQSKGAQSVKGKTGSAKADTTAVASPSPAACQPKAQSQAQPKRLPKPYVPRKGTAAYTLLICLFREKSCGRPVLTKEELLNLGEDSNLAKEPLRHASAAAEAARGNYHKTYGGWSCMKVRTSCWHLLFVANLRPPQSAYACVVLTHVPSLPDILLHRYTYSIISMHS